jgi:hypothetical protein
MRLRTGMSITVFLGCCFIFLCSLAFGMGARLYGVGDPACQYESATGFFYEDKNSYVITGKCTVYKEQNSTNYTYLARITTDWFKISKSVQEKVGVYPYQPEAPSVGEGVLTAKCPDDPVLYPGDCTSVNYSGIYGQGIPAQLLSRAWIPEVKKAELRSKLEEKTLKPKIESPLDKHVYGDGFKIDPTTYRVPIFVTMKAENNIELKFKLQKTGTDETSQWTEFIPYTQFKSAPYGGGTIYALTLNKEWTDTGKYEIKAAAYGANWHSDDSDPVTFYVGERKLFQPSQSKGLVTATKKNADLTAIMQRLPKSIQGLDWKPVAGPPPGQALASKPASAAGPDQAKLAGEAKILPSAGMSKVPAGWPTGSVPPPAVGPVGPATALQPKVSQPLVPTGAPTIALSVPAYTAPARVKLRVQADSQFAVRYTLEKKENGGYREIRTLAQPEFEVSAPGEYRLKARYEKGVSEAFAPFTVKPKLISAPPTASPVPPSSPAPAAPALPSAPPANKLPAGKIIKTQ